MISRQCIYIHYTTMIILATIERICYILAKLFQSTIIWSIQRKLMNIVPSLHACVSCIGSILKNAEEFSYYQANLEVNKRTTPGIISANATQECNFLCKNIILFSKKVKSLSHSRREIVTLWIFCQAFYF